MTKTITKIALVTTALISTFAMIGSASAENYNRGHRGHGGYHAPAPVYRSAPSHGHGYGHAPQHHRGHNGGDKIAKGVAIGVGALILGTILANEANRHRHNDGY